MKFFDCDIDSFIERNRNRKIVLFGAGINIRFVEYGKISALKERVAYVIDNGNLKEFNIWGKNIPVFTPQKLKEETGCSVIITTSKYTTEMYSQLEEMSLSDDFEVYVYPFMLLKEKYSLSEKERKEIFNTEKAPVIPKIIHSFWFSGSEKPVEYQSCIDTWSKMCPDYEIKEWNLDNYNNEDHPFFKKAIELKAWAYATDYARLDVMSKYGGIYMDMDVELVKPLDSLLSHDGVFPYCSDGVIELAMYMAKKEHPLVKQMRSLYDNELIPETKADFNRFYQPAYVMNSFIDYGVSMDGSYQKINNNVFLPRQICMPLDYCLYELNTDGDTVAIHRANAGWHDADYTKRRVRANKELIERLTSL